MAHHHDDGVGYAHGEGEYGHTPPGAGHEHTDANAWIIVKFGLWLAVSAILIHIGMAFVFGLFVEQREEVDHQFPLAVGQEPRLPAAPRLQMIPVNDIYQFRRQEAEALESYRWVDRNEGRVQIPINEAMRLAVERGLPSRAPQQDAAVPQDATTPQGAAAQPVTAQPTAAAPGLIPADSSAGRTMERRRQ